MSAAIQPQGKEQDLLIRAHAVGLCAELLAGAGDPARGVKELMDALRGFDVEAVDLEGVAAAAKVIETGAVPAYETSYEASRGAPGGMTFQMADIAGFYRAFGFEVSGERPDHLVPELEFLALLLVKEGYARMSGEVEGAELCAAARAKFMVEHLGAWLPSLVERTREAQGGEPLARIVQTVLRLGQPAAPGSRA